MSERAWGFKSPLAHVFEKDPDATYGSVGVFLYARTFVFLTMVQCRSGQGIAGQGIALGALAPLRDKTRSHERIRFSVGTGSSI
ncbi:hypothetical protein CVS29_07235 [Arthrobacter psychrochitiniphilus]|uniref:Uncharacterized protein n=1 Tax=Arthrobacter psychrochitiniphilus TaxID=291045 RepID=A0A2V3DYG0_9MICC|nr:hypothetical protein CVS29_07235 [Arthrobacter psychrochitiniphilus]